MDSRDFGVRHLRFQSCLCDLPALWQWTCCFSSQPLHPRAYPESGSRTRSIGISGNLLETPRLRSHPDSLTLDYRLIMPQVIRGRFEVWEACSVSLSVRIYHGLCDNSWPGLQLSSQSISKGWPLPHCVPLDVFFPQRVRWLTLLLT